MELFDKIIDTFAKKINYVRRASMGVPKTFVINLALPLTDQPYHISGNIYYVWSAPIASSYIDIKVNKSSEPALRCLPQTGLRTPFDKLLITTPPGQTGDMVILYGTESPEMLEVIDNRAAVVAGVGDLLTIETGILAELQGDLAPEAYGYGVSGLIADQLLAVNADRKSFSIQALSTNKGIIYVGFDNAVAVNHWWAELQAGQSCGGDDYRGPIWTIANLAGQIYGCAEV